MKISVIVPFHRGADYLKDCLDSLQEQSYSNIEVLIVSDHASPEELKIVDEYISTLDIRMYHLDNKTGVAAARNLGLEQASGDYVYFLDSDDYLYADTLETLMLTLEEENYDIVYGKKIRTWFHREVYLARKREEELEEKEEEEEDNESESAELDGDSEAADSKDDEKEDTEEDNDNSSDGNEVKMPNIDDPKLLSADEAFRILVSKRKGVRNLSILHILIKRSFIEENNIRFFEDQVYFSDCPFLIEVLSKAESFRKCLSAIYIKRNHNDPINLPSLSQIKDPNRFKEFIDNYYRTTNMLDINDDLKRRFDKKYINYYTNTFAPRMKRSNNMVWREEYFDNISDIIGGMDRELLRSYKKYKRRAIKALVRKDVKKSLRVVKAHLGYKKFKKIIKNRMALGKSLYIHLFMKRPVKDNWIIFESFLGKNYSDSPKYIYEYLAKNYPGKYKFIWIINKKTRIPYKHTSIKRFSIRYFYYMARCKYFVFNSRQPVWIIKREDTVFLQTWHGTPLKKLVFDIDDISSASPKYKQQVFKQSREWDYLIAPNAFSSETFRRCFMYDKEMLETGYPRNDILHAPNKKEIADKIKDRIGIPRDKKTILYAPTWRDDEYYGKGQYKFELHLNLDKMKKELGDEYVILLRTHYFIADSLDVSALKGFAYNVSKYDDISELYLVSDILITDYSSVFFDFANLKRPMLFYTYDLEKYRDILRGFYLDIEKEVPGPLLFTTDEVIDAINNIDSISKQYEQTYNEFYQRFCQWEDGHASEKVVKLVFK
ncbi:MAG TPA: CDP-glycerol:glycerophosphate glycerophosphotransferase [Clostridiales bacterium]|nr:CDP-glycerol:glycerophosphate glycerophosphotransferase [Clostridiales bacterium]